MRQLLYLFAHPNFSHSVMSKALLEEVYQHPQFLFRDLYELYPDFHIDVAREQQLLEEYDGIIVHFPLRWYALPSLLKEWIDVVFAPGFAFGQRGQKLQDKFLIPIVTAGGTQASYAAGGKNIFPISHYLISLEQTAKYCHMNYIEPLVFYGVHRLNQEEDLVKAREFFREELTKLTTEKNLKNFSTLKFIDDF
ncbi:MAG: NAD(P)H-dependent oxidoreductase [Bacteriovoracaceae bacterium]|nr:NAD(P)H-dependent oxidoreductase [Bacteriovoracaceae bacterium]